MLGAIAQNFVTKCYEREMILDVEVDNQVIHVGDEVQVKCRIRSFSVAAVVQP